MRSWVKSIGAYLAGLKGLKEALYAGFEAIARIKADSDFGEPNTEDRDASVA